MTGVKTQLNAEIEKESASQQPPFCFISVKLL